jgi:hypothetical protein
VLKKLDSGKGDNDRFLSFALLETFAALRKWTSLETQVFSSHQRKLSSLPSRGSNKKRKLASSNLLKSPHFGGGVWPRLPAS